MKRRNLGNETNQSEMISESGNRITLTNKINLGNYN